MVEKRVVGAMVALDKGIMVFGDGRWENDVCGQRSGLGFCWKEEGHVPGVGAFPTCGCGM
jgi:hypothetical protein